MDPAAIMFACSCGQHLKVPASGAGKEFKCPKCGSVVVCPAVETVTAAVEPAPPGVQVEAKTSATPQAGQAPGAAPAGPSPEHLRQQAQMMSFWDRLTTDTPATYWLWIGLGGGLGCLVPLGIILSITVIGACLGIPMSGIGGGAAGFAGVLLIYRYVRKKSDATVPVPPAPASAPSKTPAESE